MVFPKYFENLSTFKIVGGFRRNVHILKIKKKIDIYLGMSLEQFSGTVTQNKIFFGSPSFK